MTPAANCRFSSVSEARQWGYLGDVGRPTASHEAFVTVWLRSPELVVKQIRITVTVVSGSLASDLSLFRHRISDVAMSTSLWGDLHDHPNFAPAFSGIHRRDRRGRHWRHRLAVSQPCRRSAADHPRPAVG